MTSSESAVKKRLLRWRKGSSSGTTDDAFPGMPFYLVSEV